MYVERTKIICVFGQGKDEDKLAERRKNVVVRFQSQLKFCLTGSIFLFFKKTPVHSALGKHYGPLTCMFVFIALYCSHGRILFKMPCENPVQM